jgi:hypothetical protein
LGRFRRRCRFRLTPMQRSHHAYAGEIRRSSASIAACHSSASYSALGSLVM